jgi:hypothetical protein
VSDDDQWSPRIDRLAIHCPRPAPPFCAASAHFHRSAPALPGTRLIDQLSSATKADLFASMIIGVACDDEGPLARRGFSI